MRVVRLRFVSYMYFCESSGRRRHRLVLSVGSTRTHTHTLHKCDKSLPPLRGRQSTCPCILDTLDIMCVSVRGVGRYGIAQSPCNRTYWLVVIWLDSLHNGSSQAHRVLPAHTLWRGMSLFSFHGVHIVTECGRPLFVGQHIGLQM